MTFPCSMVDRIVPATTPEDVEEISRAIGARDPAAVVGEPFRQWVIEDKFAGDRPPLDLAGAEFVADSKPYEQIKMRVLNAAQSTLAHQGALVGLEFSYQAAADPALSALTRRMLERETSSTLPKVAGMEVGRTTSISRWRASATPQFGTAATRSARTDRRRSSQRLLDPLRERLAAGRPADLLDALGRELDRLLPERSAAVRRALDAFRPLRGNSHRDRRSHLRLRRAGQIRSRHRRHLRRGYGASATGRSDRAAFASACFAATRASISLSGSAMNSPPRREPEED